MNKIPDDLFEQMKLLSKFPEDSQLQGIKIRKDADPSIIQSAEALFNKGLITNIDGGYLTNCGLETFEHLQHVLETLK